jgi:hypothetical protein
MALVSSEAQTLGQVQSANIADVEGSVDSDEGSTSDSSD